MRCRQKTAFIADRHRTSVCSGPSRRSNARYVVRWSRRITHAGRTAVIEPATRARVAVALSEAEEGGNHSHMRATPHTAVPFSRPHAARTRGARREWMKQTRLPHDLRGRRGRRRQDHLRGHCRHATRRAAPRRAAPHRAAAPPRHATPRHVTSHLVTWRDRAFFAEGCSTVALASSQRTSFMYKTFVPLPSLSLTRQVPRQHMFAHRSDRHDIITHNAIPHHSDAT